MRILFVVPSMGYGGAERVISILANSLSFKDSVRIIMINEEDRCVYQLNDNIQIQRVNPINKKKILTIPLLFKNLRKSIKDYDPDVIISFINDTCALTAIANIGLRYPLIYSERNDPLNTNKTFKDKILKYIVMYLSNGYVFQSEGAKNLYPKRIKDKSTVILNPIDKEIFPKMYTGIRTKEIVSVGRLHSQKNQKMLINSFKNISDEYPEYKLIIYGEGSLRQALQDQIDMLQLTERVILAGNQSNVLEKINSASVYAFTSDFEGLPNALIEAMVLGLPCISTDCSPGGAAMLIDNYVNGILVPKGSEKDFSDGLRYLLSNKEHANQMGEKASHIIDKIKVENIIEEWKNFIQYVIRKEFVKSDKT